MYSQVSVQKIYGYLHHWDKAASRCGADVFQMQRFSEVGSKGCQQESQEGKPANTSADQFCKAIFAIYRILQVVQNAWQLR